LLRGRQEFVEHKIREKVVDAIELIRTIKSECAAFGSYRRIPPNGARRDADADDHRQLLFCDKVVEYGRFIGSDAVKLHQQACRLSRIVLGGNVDLKVIRGPRIDFGIGNRSVEKLATGRPGVRLAIFQQRTA
jgi:hypothetical protein